MHPFFLQQAAWTGSAIIDKQPYNDLRLLYDVYSDVLVLEFNLNGNPIWMEVNRERVESFNLEQREFINVATGKTPGYLELLTTSKLRQLLSKRRKLQYINNGDFDLKEDHLFYISNKEGLNLISNRKHFYNIYPGLQTEIKKYIKVNKLDISLENDLIKLFDYCEAKIQEE